MRKVGVGVVGCGNISGIYLENMTQKLDNLKVIAVADLVEEKAKAAAEKFGIPKVLTVDEMLEDSEIEIIVNLTIPISHYEICKKALLAGKHVYVEKPLCIDTADGLELLKLSSERGLFLGGAPDTFLGGGLQSCIKRIEEGMIGTPVAASASMACRGHETWHPDPEFYYKKGGGPLLDMGPYYITALVAALGPIKAVTANARASFAQRTITSQPKHGNKIDVETPTHILAILEFESGLLADVTMSFDVGPHNKAMLEIYGSEGTIALPDPNTFGGNAKFCSLGGDWEELEPIYDYLENFRGLGVSDMANSILEDRPINRASGRLAAHVLEVMNGALLSAEEGRKIVINTTCEKPKLLSE